MTDPRSCVFATTVNPQQEAALHIDPIIPKPEIVKASNLSEPTIYREQRAGRFPPFDQISTRRVGLRLSTFSEWLDGRRDWGDES
jgi:predicted DNA-binding transcriptional regulator AlpA